MKTRIFAMFAAALVSTAPLSAFAEDPPPPVQLASGLLIGGGIQRFTTTDRKAAFYLGGRFDLDVVRKGPKSLGFGPYVELGSVALRSFEAGGGANLTIPVGSPTLQLAAGPHVRWDDAGRHLGLTTTALFGSRSYNYHSKYGFSAGGFLQGRFALDGSAQRDLLLGVQLDFELLALPFLLGLESLKHGTP
jgi:hypothetical protein